MLNPKCIIIGVPALVRYSLCAMLESLGVTDVEICGDIGCFPIEESDVPMIVSAEQYLFHLSQLAHYRGNILIYHHNVEAAHIEELISAYSSPEQIMQSLKRNQTMPESSEREVGKGPELSVREKDVLRQIAAGKAFKEIADSLCISVNTVLTHRKNISSKLGIRSVAGLSLYAMMNGLLE